MLKRLQNRAREDAGFTLIELMVVVLIIGILVAIALPTFLGARTRSQNRAAQSDLRNTLVAAKTIYTDNSSYATATAANLPAVEGSLVYTTAASTTAAPLVSVAATPTATGWGAARMSASGVCYGIRENATNGTFFITNLGTCTGDAALADTGTLRAWT